MSTRFEIALIMKHVHEGRGEAPNDPGGRTDWGISERAHPELWADGKVTEEETTQAFRETYWGRIAGDKLADFRLALEAFDACVLAQEAAPRDLQRCCNELMGGQSGYTPLVVDGIIGPKTIGALNSLAAQPELADAMLGLFYWYRIEHFRKCAPVRQRLAAGQTTGIWNDRRGWLRRVGCGERWAAMYPDVQ